MTKGKDDGSLSRPGPDRGRGHGPGHGPGPGHGYGHGHGPGRGYGHGPSPGPGRGYGHGPGPGRGYDHGPGPGHGYGHGPGPGHGYGHGPGPFHGYGHGPGPVHGYGHSPGPVHGYGHGPGPFHGYGHGPGPFHGYGPGPGHGSVRGHAHAPRGKASGSHGRGRGRANDAVCRSEEISGRSAGKKLGGDSTPSSAESVGSLTSWPGKQPQQNGLHELLLGLRSSGRGYNRTNKDTDLNLLGDGNTSRRGGRLSWVDMRRQSQRSNSTADSSSEPDVSQRTFQNCGSIGGWGGRGRGRLLDSSSVNKLGSEEDTSGWSGRGRGGILYVPGVNFHSGRNSTEWKHYGTGNQGTLNSRHSVGGFSKNYTVQSRQLFSRKENVTAHSDENMNPTELDKECNNGTKSDNCVDKQVIDIISSTEDNKLLQERKYSNENIEENLEKQLVIRNDDGFCKDAEKSTVPVNCSIEQNADSKEYCKPRLLSPHGGRTRGIILFRGSLFTDEGTLVTQNPVSCGNEKKENPSDP